MPNHPYKELEADPLWDAVSKALSALEKNRDIMISTRRELVVGYIVKACVCSRKPPGRKV